MHRDWKGEGILLSPAGQLKVIFLGPKGFQWGGMIRGSKNSSKLKVVGSMWNLNYHVVLAIQNRSQLVSHKMEIVCS